MKKIKKSSQEMKEYFLLHVLENDRLLYIEATDEIKKKHVKDNRLVDYLILDGKELSSPIVKIFKIDSQGKEIDISTPEIQANLYKFLSTLLVQSQSHEPNIDQVFHKKALVKSSMHLQLQKQGKQLTPKNDLFTIINNETDYKKKEELSSLQTQYSIEVVGIELSKSQEKALFAIQTMLNNTDYKGNISGHEIHSSSMIFDGYLPAIKFTPSEYLSIYGVSKKDHGRGYLEYSNNERDEALKALRDLSENRFLMFYKRQYWVEKIKDYKYDIIKTIRPLINITEGFEQLTKKETNSIEQNSSAVNEKLTTIVIEPNPILLDQIDNYFVLKPADCYQEIKLLAGNASKFVYRFVDYLLTEVAQRNRKGVSNWNIKINYETLGTILRMDSYIKSRNWKLLRKSINNCYETAVKLGYVLSYQIDQQGVSKEIDNIELNPDKFNQIDKMNKRRSEIEEEHKFNTLPNRIANTTQ